MVAGHAVLDEIVEDKSAKVTRNELGGALSYSALSLGSLGYKPKVITIVGRDFPTKYINLLRSQAGIEIEEWMKHQQKTTRFKIDTTGRERKMWLQTRSRKFRIGDFIKATNNFQHTRAALILNPVAGEISSDLLRQVKTKFKYIFVDSQGFVRQFDPKSGLVSGKEKLEISALKGIWALKADQRELFAWTGFRSRQAAIERISKYIENLLVTSAAKKVELYCKGKITCSARPLEVRVSDTTGAGDILLATFAMRYLETFDLREALEFATTASSLAIRKVGIKKAILSRSEILDRQKEVRVAD